MKQYVRKITPANMDKKERNCLKCGKKVVGRWLCDSCFKYNSTLDDVLSRYEIHEFPNTETIEGTYCNPSCVET